MSELTPEIVAELDRLERYATQLPLRGAVVVKRGSDLRRALDEHARALIDAAKERDVLRIVFADLTKGQPHIMTAEKYKIVQEMLQQPTRKEGGDELCGPSACVTVPTPVCSTASNPPTKFDPEVGGETFKSLHVKAEQSLGYWKELAELQKEKIDQLQTKLDREKAFCDARVRELRKHRELLALSEANNRQLYKEHDQLRRELADERTNFERRKVITDQLYAELEASNTRREKLRADLGLANESLAAHREACREYKDELTAARKAIEAKDKALRECLPYLAYYNVQHRAAAAISLTVGNDFVPPAPKGLSGCEPVAPED